MSIKITRRDFLGAAAGVTAVGLGACGGGETCVTGP